MELLKNTADEVLTTTHTSLDTSDANTVAIINLTSQFRDLRDECVKLRKENAISREQNNRFGLYSRNKNLILHVIVDTDHENNTTYIIIIYVYRLL